MKAFYNILLRLLTSFIFIPTLSLFVALATAVGIIAITLISVAIILFVSYNLLFKKEYIKV